MPLVGSASHRSCSNRIATPARARQRHELAILEAHGMRRLDRESTAEVLVDIEAMAASHLRPKLIFMRCLDLLAQRRIQLPSEYRLTGLIAAAMMRRKRELVERVEQVLTPELREALDALLASDGEESGGAGYRQASAPDPPQEAHAVDRREGRARPCRGPRRDWHAPRAVARRAAGDRSRTRGHRLLHRRRLRSTGH